jgi:hypothetical protein
VPAAGKIENKASRMRGLIWSVGEVVLSEGCQKCSSWGCLKRGETGASRSICGPMGIGLTGARRVMMGLIPACFGIDLKNTEL